MGYLDDRGARRAFNQLQDEGLIRSDVCLRPMIEDNPNQINAWVESTNEPESCRSAIFFTSGLIDVFNPTPDEFKAILLHEYGHHDHEHGQDIVEERQRIFDAWLERKGETEVNRLLSMANSDMGQLVSHFEFENKAELNSGTYQREFEADRSVPKKYKGALYTFLEKLYESGIDTDVLSDHPAPELRASIAAFEGEEEIETDEE